MNSNELREAALEINAHVVAVGPMAFTAYVSWIKSHFNLSVTEASYLASFAVNQGLIEQYTEDDKWFIQAPAGR